MELTIDEALKKGVEAHKAGQVQEAEKLYTAIIQARSKHPDANHNMGVLAVGVGKIKEALPFFRIALETNSGIAQFWLSYVDALIKIGALDDARNMINQAKKKGIEGTIFCQLEQSIGQLNANGDRASSDSNNSTQSEVNVLDTKNLNQALRLAKKKAKDGFNADAKKIYQNIIDRFPRNSKALEGLKSLFQETVTEVEGQEPEQNQLQSLIDLYSKGQLQQVLAQAEQMLLRFPKSFSLYNILGAASAGLNKLDVAIDNYKQALNINPNHFVSYNNMGNALRSQGDLGAAIKSYKQAVKININYAEAYDNMGVALQEEGDLEAAIESYQQALKINPRYANAYNNIGVVLRGQGNLNGAIESYQKALKINPRYANAYNNLGVAQRDKGQLEAAIGSYQKALKINPELYDSKINLIETSPHFLPQKTENIHPIVTANFEIRKISLNYERLETIADNFIIKLYADCSKIINAQKIKLEYPRSQIFRKNNVDLNCDRHMALFNKNNIIPEYCFGCYKVQVEPKSVLELMKLFVVFDRIILPNDNIRKCIVELRPNISGFYKGLIYCSSLQEAKEIHDYIVTIVQKEIGLGVLINIKRGCSEYPLSFPEYKEINNFGPQLMEYNQNWKIIEQNYDMKYTKTAKPEIRSSLKGLSLSDFFIMRNWLAYAEGIGDTSVISITKNSIVAGEIYDEAKARQAIHKFIN
jgi:tetratricopeptide (TPR) repeat protein